MNGVPGLGRAALPAGGARLPPWAGELAASLDHLGVQLDAQNVLQVRRILLEEADRVKQGLEHHGRDAVVRLCGDDPVSHDAAREFTPRLQALVGEAMVVAEMLRVAGQTLGESARAYGHTEADVAASFRSAGGSPGGAGP